MRKILSLLVVLVLALLNSFSSVLAMDLEFDMSNKKYELINLDGYYKTQGRTCFIDDVLMIDYTASGIEFNAKCKGDVKVTFNSTSLVSGEGGGCYFTVIVDGVKKAREFCHITKTGDFTITIAENLPEGIHNFKIYRQTEIGHSTTIGIKSIYLDGMFLKAPDKNELYIEFVGSSTTCGFGNLGDKNITEQEIAALPIYEDGTRAFSYLVAEALNADYSIVARQGTGCKYSWQSQNMLMVYPLLRAAKDSVTEYDFNRNADIVVLGLGGNDVSKAASLNTDSDPNNDVTDEQLVDSYIEMLNLIKSKNPDAKILWVCNITTTDTATLVNKAIEKLGGSQYGYYSVSVTSNIDGAKNHPTAEAQEIIATEVTKYINDNILNATSQENSKFLGNSIRVTGNQGLRFKYSFNIEKILEENSGYSLKEIGALAIRTDYLGDNELIENGNFVFNNKTMNAAKGTFYSKEEAINLLDEEGVASAVLFNIGYNISTKTVDYEAYNYDFSVRTYFVLENSDETITLYEETKTASVFAVIDAIIETYNSNGKPIVGDLYNDYVAVQEFLNSPHKDKNGKTIKEIYDSREAQMPDGAVSYADGIVPVTDGNILYSGRWFDINSLSKQVAFEGYVEIKFSGTSIKVIAPASGNVYAEVDGELINTMYSLGSNPVIAEGLEEGVHTLKLFAQAQASRFTISGFKIDKNAKTLPVEQSKKIEFIGDSISEGYVAPEDKLDYLDNNSYLNSFALKTGRKLNQKYGWSFNTVAFGGNGIVASKADPLSMPERYFRNREYIAAIDGVTKDSALDATSVYDATSYTPDYIVLNLGTNDAESDNQVFVDEYINFIKELKKIYPNVTIFCMTPFNGTKVIQIKLAVSNFNENDNVYLIDSSKWNISGGTDGLHPSPESNNIIAEKLLSDIENYVDNGVLPEVESFVNGMKFNVTSDIYHAYPYFRTSGTNATGLTADMADENGYIEKSYTVYNVGNSDINIKAYWQSGWYDLSDPNAMSSVAIKKGGKCTLTLKIKVDENGLVSCSTGEKVALTTLTFRTEIINSLSSETLIPAGTSYIIIPTDPKDMSVLSIDYVGIVKGPNAIGSANYELIKEYPN